MGERKAGVGTENGGSGRGNRLIGVAMTALGIFIVLISANIIPMADSTFSAPRWFAGGAGLAILLGGAAIVLARPGSTPGSIVANSYLGCAAGAMLVFMLNWIAFGPGTRHFSGGLALPFLSVSGRASEWSGRAAFGFGAVLMDVLVLWLVARGMRQYVRGRRERAGDPAP
jgi:hypothetical protein